MKIVVDSNVIISALASEGIAKKTMAIVIAEHHGCWTKHIQHEVERILRDKFKIPAKALQAATTYLHANLIELKPRGKPPEICRDPDDNHILHAATAPEIDIILTGDRDLLTLKQFNKVRILSIREFLAEVIP